MKIGARYFRRILHSLVGVQLSFLIFSLNFANSEDANTDALPDSRYTVIVPYPDSSSNSGSLDGIKFEITNCKFLRNTYPLLSKPIALHAPDREVTVSVPDKYDLSDKALLNGIVWSSWAKAWQECYAWVEDSPKIEPEFSGVAVVVFQSTKKVAAFNATTVNRAPSAFVISSAVELDPTAQKYVPSDEQIIVTELPMPKKDVAAQGQNIQKPTPEGNQPDQNASATSRPMPSETKSTSTNITVTPTSPKQEKPNNQFGESMLTAIAIFIFVIAILLVLVGYIISKANTKSVDSNTGKPAKNIGPSLSESISHLEVRNSNVSLIDKRIAEAQEKLRQVSQELEDRKQ